MNGNILGGQPQPVIVTVRDNGGFIFSGRSMFLLYISIRGWEVHLSNNVKVVIARVLVIVVVTSRVPGLYL